MISLKIFNQFAELIISKWISNGQASATVITNFSFTSFGRHYKYLDGPYIIKEP